MSTLNDLWFSYLGDLGYTGSLPDRLHKALQAESGETALKSLNDMWNTYLVGEGYTSGTLDDKVYAWLGDKGYVGSITDRWYGALSDGDIFVVAPSGAVYPLNATEAELQDAGLTGKLSNPSLGEQKGEFVVPDGAPGSTEQYSMARSTSEGDFSKDWSVGAVAMEFEMEVPTFTPEGAGTGGIAYNSRGEVVSSVNFQPIVLLSNYIEDDSDRFLAVTGPNGSVAAVTTTQTTNRIGLLLDNGSNTLRVWFNNVEQTFTDPSYPAGTFSSVTPLLSVIRQTGVDDNGAAGTTLTCRFVTDTADFTTTFPAGSRDIDGNVFN